MAAPATSVVQRPLPAASERSDAAPLTVVSFVTSMAGVNEDVLPP